MTTFASSLSNPLVVSCLLRVSGLGLCGMLVSIRFFLIKVQFMMQSREVASAEALVLHQGS